MITTAPTDLERYENKNLLGAIDKQSLVWFTDWEEQIQFILYIETEPVAPQILLAKT